MICVPGLAAGRVSVLRVRIGILLFLLWWLPFYLLAPAIADVLGVGDDPAARREITIWIVCIQTLLGVVGAYLAGRELVATLGRVRRRRLLAVAWRIVWSGDTRIADEDLKQPDPPADVPAPAEHRDAGSPSP